MTPAPGSRVGPYEVIALLGEGGMGKVWRARDTKLDRDVAIKVLPETFAGDPNRLARFQREAKTLAALSHPNIAHIYGLEEGSGQASLALVMELVEGPTLADRIAQGPLPVDDALPIAGQIAEALEAAHEQNIIHRDLKPANIKVRPDGTVKVLDFGLAKAMEPSGSAAGSLANSPTITSPATELGVILGTAAYMSPEQARGKIVNRRADVWAFGCVLYEMLTGRQTFPNGETVADTLVGVLGREPNWHALPAETPVKIRALLERCLRKDPRRRLPDVAQARIEIEEARTEPEAPAAAVTPASNWRGRAGWVLALLFFLTTAGTTTWVLMQPRAERPTVRFSVFPPPGAQVATVELSPDGRKLAFHVFANGKRSIWVHDFDVAATRPIPSTEDAVSSFFWSADSRFIGFSSDGKLKKVQASGGPAQVVANLPGLSGGMTRFPLNGGTWNQEGVILLRGPGSGPIMRVDANGGQLVPAGELDKTRNEQLHRFPSFLPDGRHYLYVANSGDSQNDLAFVGTLDSTERRPLSGITSRVRYSSSGHLIFIRGGALMAQSFDVKRLELSGEPFAVADPFVQSGVLSAAFSVSTTGSLAWFSSSAPGTRQLTWFDRKGKQLGIAGPAGDYQQPDLSPDGRFVAFQQGQVPTSNQGDRIPDANIWVLDLERGVSSPLTSDPGRETSPVWSPNSQKIAFDAVRNGQRSLFERPFGVVGKDTLLLQTTIRNLSDWSSNGYLVYDDAADIWALLLPISPAAKPLRITDSPSVEVNARVSPDGRWIAYESNELREQAEVYIQSFPNPGWKQQVSKGGGAQPVWSHDMKELFYLAPDNTLMSVSIAPTGSSLKLGVPVSLFPTRADIRNRRGYSVSRDGRFLMSVPAQGPDAISPITVILNWRQQTALR